MAIKSKLFFENTNGWSTQFPNGGLPILNTDIEALENTSKLYGVWAITNKWNVIISGCEVDEVNLTTKTVKINSGYFTINGIMYFTEGFTSNFPCALVPTTTEIDTRLFKNGNIEDVATTFSAGVVTTGFNAYNDIFNTNPSGSLKPDNLSNCIFFDPYTHQRIEYILSNLPKGLNEKRIGEFKVAFSKTETLKNQIGGACNENSNLNLGRWKYYGYEFETSEYFPFIGNGTPSITTGSNQLFLAINNIPAHTHNININTNTAGAHNHKFNYAIRNDARDGSQKTYSVLNVNEYPEKITSTSGDHYHNISGDTNGGNGLNSTPVPINIKPINQIVHSIKWKGYKVTDAYFIKNIPQTNR